MTDLQQNMTPALAVQEQNWRKGLRRFLSNPLSVVGLAILLILLIIAFLAPQIVPFPEDAQGNMRV